MSRFSTGRQIFLFALALGLWAFLVFIRWFATREQLYFISATELDTVAHLAGGVFLVLILEWRTNWVSLPWLLAFIAVITVGWEVLELLFDAEMGFLFQSAFDFWLLDSLGDIVAAFLGGYGYWVFAFHHRQDFRPF